jgi:hypothetical protein
MTIVDESGGAVCGIAEAPRPTMNWQLIHGWMDFPMVYDEAVAFAPGGAIFVEVGCWLGRSTAYLAQRIKESGKSITLYAVDNWQGGDEDENRTNGDARRSAVAKAVGNDPERLLYLFVRNMCECGFSGAYSALVLDSVLAAGRFKDRSLQFVFVDADHTEQRVYADLCAWWPKVAPGGTMAGHDFNETGPNAAVCRFALENRLWLYGNGVWVNHMPRCWGIRKAP